MPRITGTFTADGDVSREVLLEPGQKYVASFTASPSLTGKVQVQSRDLSTAKYTVVAEYTATQALTEYTNTSKERIAVRLACPNLDAGTETVAYVLQSLISTGRRFIVNHRPKVGATAGWAVNAANNLGLCATLPAGQTASTLVVPLDNLELGDRITGFYAVGQVESAGNTASLTINLRSLTAAAADVVDASVATTGAVSYTADTALGRIGALAVDGLNVLVEDGVSYYFLITGTTAASTDVALQGVMVQIVRHDNAASVM